MQEPLPPILIRHGDADTMVADLQAKRLRESWLAADPKAVINYKLVPGAGHGGAAFETGEVKTDILAFVRQALG
jgi:pimeloyl-ACP methyl ester carboxylesterase